MLDKKRRLFRLIENYINDYQGGAVQEMYGKGSYIKIHNLNFSVTQQSVLLEAVIVLGDLITEGIKMFFFAKQELADPFEISSNNNISYLIHKWWEPVDNE